MQIELPQAFLSRMRGQLGDAFPAYLRAMDAPARRALRVNTLKTTPKRLAAAIGFPLTGTDVSPECFLVPDDATVGKHPLHRAGHFYMQEPSAQRPVAALPLADGMAVLDLCAAPGGKSTQIAARLHNTGLLVANEPVASRARVLASNLERMGARNAVAVCADPAPLCEALSGCFDAVLVDAPCSGEGMFKKEPDAVRDWSLSHVAACAVRQGHILDSAAAALVPGGTLVYSTCTFSPEENEGVVEAFLHAHGDFSCALTRRVYPQDGPGEGQFYALLRRAGAGRARVLSAQGERVALWDAFSEQYLKELSAQRARLLPDGRVFLLPALLPPELSRFHVLAAGVCAGNVVNGRFEPSHALAMAFPDSFRQTVPLDGPACSAYLRGETVPCARELSGWCAVSTGDAVLGLGKAVSGTLKNHLPKGLRG